MKYMSKIFWAINFTIATFLNSCVIFSSISGTLRKNWKKKNRRFILLALSSDLGWDHIKNSEEKQKYKMRYKTPSPHFLWASKLVFDGNSCYWFGENCMRVSEISKSIRLYTSSDYVGTSHQTCAREKNNITMRNENFKFNYNGWFSDTASLSGQFESSELIFTNSENIYFNFRLVHIDFQDDKVLWDWKFCEY